MSIRNVVAWNTMVVGCGNYGDGNEVMRLLREMLREGFLPDELTISSVISSCGYASAITETLQAHAFAPDLVAWTSLICAYAFHGLAKEATGDVYMWDGKKGKDKPLVATRMPGVKEATSVSVGETHLLLVASLYHPVYPINMIDNSQKLKSTAECLLEPRNAIQLLEIADSLGADDLKKYCEDIVMRNLDYIFSVSAHAVASASLDILASLEGLLDQRSSEAWSYRRLPTPTAILPVTIDSEEEDEKVPDSAGAKVNGESGKKGYVGIHSSGFRDFLLKPELLRAIVDSGFEHPSEVQHECIPQAIWGMGVLCQAKSGMGKTVVFVLSTLQQIDPIPGQVSALILCHTRELAYQICHESERFSTYLTDLKVVVFYVGVNIKVHKDLLKNERPQIVVGTPGRILALSRDKDLSLKNVRHFILDECDKMLESLDMRNDVQDIFKLTPHDKQVMMFSATLSKEIRPVCKKLMQDPMEIYVDDEAKLTLHGLVQHYIKLKEEEKKPEVE
ncbi:hypothetical protein KIW84_021999 [Lathyrus oleraceus]|uniref:RNA helicase n=2 Tax=Pisum sativum TaxID=3888 RepID=A0A9D5BAM5_PEA|nr:hypothetical protein KIW84_021999 [Pisum sativum]